MPKEQDIQSLYNSVSNKFDIGTFDEFKSKMKTEEQRKSFYDIVSSKGYDLGNYNEYETRLKKKEGFGDFSKEYLLSEKEQPSISGFRTVYKKGGEKIEGERTIDPNSFDYEIFVPTFEYDEKEIIEKQISDKKSREEKKIAYSNYLKESNLKIDSMLEKYQDKLTKSQQKYDNLYVNSYQEYMKTGKTSEETNKFIPEYMTEINDASQKINNLNIAKDLLKKTDKYLNTLDSGVLESIFKSQLAKDFFSMGLTDMIMGINILDIANASKKRDLTEDEEMALFAYGLNQTLKSDKDIEQKLSSMVGTGIISMVPYMVQFALTSGTATSASTAVKEILKKSTKKQINKYVISAIGELSGAAVRATIMPEMYRQVPERMIGQITPEITEKNSYIGKVNEETQKGIGEALTRSYLNTVIEVGVEGFGKYTPKVINKINSKLGTGKMIDELTNSTVKELRSLSGFDDIFSEFLEEIVTGYAQAPIEQQKMTDVWDKKQLLATFLTVSATGGAFNGMELAVNGINSFKQSAIKDYRKTEQNLDIKTQVKVDKILKNKDVEDISNNLDVFIKEEKSKGASDEQIKNIIDYAGQKIRLESAIEAEEIVHQENKVEEKLKPEEVKTETKEIVEKEINPEEIKPEEVKTVEVKPEEIKAVEVKPEEIKSVEIKTETKEIVEKEIIPEEVKTETKKLVEEEKLPINVIQTKKGLFELKENQIKQKQRLIDKYGEENANKLMQEIVNIKELKKYNIEEPKIKQNEKEKLQQEKPSEIKTKKQNEVKLEKEKILESNNIEKQVSLKTSKTKKTSKLLALSLGKTIETKNIEVDGEKIGYIEAGIFDDGNIRMNNIRIENEKFKGKGFGKKSYIDLNKEANEKGGVLISSETMSEDAKKVWESLVNDGLAIKENEIFKFKENAEEIRKKNEETMQEKGIVEEELQRLRVRDDEKNRMETETKEKELKERKLGKKALESVNLPEDFKKDLSEKGIAYAVKGRAIENKEANEIIKSYYESGNIGELKETILNLSNDIPGNVRTTLSTNYVKHNLDKAEKEKGEKREKLIRDAVEVFNNDMMLSTEQAQALESKKRWLDIIGRNPDLLVESIKQRTKKSNDKKLEVYIKDVENSQQIIEDFLNSKQFNDIIEQKVKQTYKEYLQNRKNAVDKINQGKDKLADAVSRMASLKGIKKNAIDENNINNNFIEFFKILVDAADGVLDIGIGSTSALISKLKVYFREYIKPSEIDKYSEQIIKETNANKRLKKRHSKKNVLTDKELEKMVNSLYAKMTRPITKQQLRKLSRDYIDKVVEIGEIDKESFKDLFASAIGMETLTPKLETELRKYSEALNDSRVIGENLKYLWEKYKIKIDNKQDISGLEKDIDEQIKTYKDSLEKAKYANIKISEIFTDPKTIGELLSTFIQGNLLTTIPQLTNIAANLSWAPVRGIKNIVATFLDIGLSKIGKLKPILQENIDPEKYPYLYKASNLIPDEKRTYDYFAANKGYYPGFKEGFIEALQQIITGHMPDDVYRREISQALHPLQAMVKTIDLLSNKEKRNIQDIVKNALEATLGIPPEIMFRFLNLGDKPFRRATEKARLSEIAKIKGLKGKDREIFMIMPDEASFDEARQAGLEATYQQDTKISKFVNGIGNYSKKEAQQNMTKLDKFVKGMTRLILKAHIPYVKTPINIAIETFDYAIPIWSIYQGVQYAVKGNRRKSLDYFSRAIVGGIISSAFVNLIKTGIMSLAPAGMEEEEEGKAGIKASEYRDKPSYHINLSAYIRYITGNDPTWQENDLISEYKRFGILSSIAMAKAEAYRGYKVGDTEFEKDGYLAQNLSGILPILRSSLDQSFLSGVNSGLTALMKGGYEQDRYLLNLARSFSATAIPNTYVAINQYRDKYIREIKDRSLKGLERNKKEIKNQFKSMLTTENGLPTKVTVWGEDVKRVPDGKGIGYILFDITHSKRYGGDFGVKIHELYESTGETKVLPSPISASINYQGNNIKLTPELYYELQKKIGANRKLFAESIVESMDWDNSSDFVKLTLLNMAYKKSDEFNSMLRKVFIYENIYEIERLDKEQNKEKNKIIK